MSASNVFALPERRHQGDPWEAWVDENVIARHFAVSTRTVRRWMHDGMPSRLIGGSRRYRQSQCQAWYEQREGA